MPTLARGGSALCVGCFAKHLDIIATCAARDGRAMAGDRPALCAASRCSELPLVTGGRARRVNRKPLTNSNSCCSIPRRDDREHQIDRASALARRSIQTGAFVDQLIEPRDCPASGGREQARHKRMGEARQTAADRHRADVRCEPKMLEIALASVAQMPFRCADHLFLPFHPLLLINLVPQSTSGDEGRWICDQLATTSTPRTALQPTGPITRRNRTGSTRTRRLLHCAVPTLPIARRGSTRSARAKDAAGAARRVPDAGCARRS